MVVEVVKKFVVLVVLVVAAEFVMVEVVVVAVVVGVGSKGWHIVGSMD